MMKAFFSLLREIGHILAREFIPKRDRGDDEFALLRVPYVQRMLGSSNAIYAYRGKRK